MNRQNKRQSTQGIMTKQTYVIFGIVFIVLVLAGAVFVREKRQTSVEPAPIPQPPVIEPPIVAPPTVDTIKDFSQAREDCKNEQCKKIINEFQKFIDAPLVDTTGWNIYKNNDYKFSLKYPKDWIFLDSDNPQYGKFVSKGSFILLSPESFDKYYVNPGEGLTERDSDLIGFIDRNPKFAEKNYQSVIRRGFENIIIFSYMLKNRIKSFIYNEISGSIIISIPRNNFSLNFSLSQNTIEKNIKVIKTIINSLVFES